MMPSLPVPSEPLNHRYQLQLALSDHQAAPTWLALDQNSGQEVVVKELPLARMSNWKQFELFEREAATLKHLTHPGVPRLLEYFRTDDKLCIVVEKVPGQSLDRLLKDGWRPTEADVFAIARQTLEILITLHAQHPPVVHRDIKPSNLMLDPGGELHLIDFGAVQHQL